MAQNCLLGTLSGSVKGSMFDLTHEAGSKSPILEGGEAGEEGQISSPSQHDSMYICFNPHFC